MGASSRTTFALRPITKLRLTPFLIVFGADQPGDDSVAAKELKQIIMLSDVKVGT